MAFQMLITNWKDRTGWTEQRIAASAGVSRVAVNNWINGKSVPELSNIPQVARMLGISWQDLAALILGQEGAAVQTMRPELAALLAKAAPLTDGELNRLTDAVDVLFPEHDPDPLPEGQVDA